MECFTLVIPVPIVTSFRLPTSIPTTQIVQCLHISDANDLPYFGAKEKINPLDQRQYKQYKYSAYNVYTSYISINILHKEGQDLMGKICVANFAMQKLLCVA